MAGQGGRGRHVLLLAALVAASLFVPAAATSAGADGNEDPRAPLAARALSAGGYHTCAILPSGAVKCWGRNNAGQLGQDSTRQYGDDAGDLATLAPVELGAGRTALALAAGLSHTCALLDDHTVKCWGLGEGGRLGQDGTARIGDQPGEMDALEPVDLGARRTATAVTAGVRHSCALLDNGRVKCWGAGLEGQLGQNSRADLGDDPGEMAALRPIDLGRGRRAIAVVAGGFHTCALLDDHTVKCWGANRSGQLGQDRDDNLGDQPGEMGALRPVNLGARRTASALTAGDHDTCVVLDDRRVKCWGTNYDGQLGIGTSESMGDDRGEMATLPTVDLGAGHTARSVSAGTSVTCALLDNRRVKCWGGGGRGQLGQDSTADIGDQPGEMARLRRVDLGPGRTARSVTVGVSHACATLDDQTLRCWGWGFAGQLGQGDTDDRGDEPGEMAALLPVPLGVPLQVALAADQRSVEPGDEVALRVTVTNNGASTITGIALHAPAIPECEQAVPDLARGESTVVPCEHPLDADDAPLFTASVDATSDQGPTVASNEIQVGVGTPLVPIEIAAGGHHTCALLSDHTVRCWGLGTEGQLGQDSTESLGDDPGEMARIPPVDLGAGRLALAITAGDAHTCALLDDRRVKCWGRGYRGQLGQDSTATIGDAPGEMAALPAVFLGPNRKARAIAAGYDHTCALLDGGTVKCWGRGTDGQLGQGRAVNVGGNPGDMASLRPISFGAGHPITAIAAGGFHNCALRDDATVRCWGDGYVGQLGDDSQRSRGDDPYEMIDVAPVELGAGRTALAVAGGRLHTCAVLDDTTLECWGYGNMGRLGQGDNTTRGDQPGEMAALPPIDLGVGRSAVAVELGDDHTCALLDDLSVKCWGEGASGQLGQGATDRLGDQPGEMAALDPVDLGDGHTARALAVGAGHSCAVLDDHTLRCWGDNVGGQLGQDDDDPLGDQPGEVAALTPIYLGVEPAAR